ncbi:MAG: PorT family protein [Bacteroidia bacterium]|nr:PorT family protein [Bacteroidia bacterium]
MILFSVAPLNLTSQIITSQIVGFNFSTMEMHVNNESVTTDGATGIHFGLLLPVNIVDHFSIQPGVLFSSKGATYLIDTIDISISPIYLEIPVNLTLDIGTDAFGVVLLAGTYFSCGVGGNKIESGGEAKDIYYGSGDSKDLKLLDLGLNIGAGIRIKGFLISARYGYGLTNLFPDDSSDTTLNNRVIGISLTSSFAGR